MNKTHYNTPQTKRRFRTIWGELEYLCAKMHYWLYVRKTRTSARRYLDRLQWILKELPENNMAILREQGLALLHELKNENGIAIKHRQREIELMKRLHKSIHRSVQAGDYDAHMAASILVGRDSAAVEQRRAILKALQKKQKGGKKRGRKKRGHS